MEPSVLRALAISLTLPTAVMGLYLPALKWEEQAFFDILGFLWLLTNLPNLLIWGLFLALLTLSIVCWAAAVLSRPRNREAEFLNEVRVLTATHPPELRDLTNAGIDSKSSDLSEGG